MSDGSVVSLGELTAADGSDGAAQSLPTDTVDAATAVMGSTKSALMNQGDGLDAAEISASRVSDRAEAEANSPARGFQFVDDKENLVDHPFNRGETPKRAFLGDADKQDLKPRREDKPKAEKPAVKKPKKPSVEASSPTPVEEEEEFEPLNLPVGKVTFVAGSMKMQVPLTCVCYESPALVLYSPIDSDVQCEPEKGEKGIFVIFPPDLGDHIPEGIPLGEKIELFSTGIYYDVDKFDCRVSIFFINL